MVGALLLAGSCHGRDNHAHGPAHVACLGDSNTFAVPPITGKAWCELLDAELDHDAWTARSFAFIGATVSGGPTTSYATAADHIARAEAEWHPDVYILAYGTNDLRRLSPAAVVAAYERVRDALRAEGRRVLVATTPPRFPPAPPDPSIAELNALLRRRIPARDIVDFDSRATSTDYDADGQRLLHRDGVHVNMRGQEKRAAAAREALVR
jgi:lysophospholipase L1-like esterase